MKTVKTLALLMLFFVVASSHAVNSDDGIIVFNPTLPGDTIPKPVPIPWPHSPAVPVLLPEAELLEGSLYFYPQVEYDVAIRIEDVSHVVVLEDEIHLYINNDNEYDVSTLPAGTYTLILGIAGREYEGEFEIE